MTTTTNDPNDAADRASRPPLEFLEKFRDPGVVQKLVGRQDAQMLQSIIDQLFDEIYALTSENEALAPARRDTEPAPPHPHCDDDEAASAASDVIGELAEVSCDEAREWVQVAMGRGYEDEPDDAREELNRFIDQAERWRIELRDLEKQVARMLAARTIAEFDSLMAALDAAEKAGAACEEATRGGAKS